MINVGKEGCERVVIKRRPIMLSGGTASFSHWDSRMERGVRNEEGWLGTLAM